MGEVVLIVVVLVLLGLVVWGGIRLARRDRSSQETQHEGTAAPHDPFGSEDVDALRGDPRRLRAGAIVEIRGHDYTVRGSLRLTEGGWSWDEHFLDDAQGKRAWLSVEEDPELEMVLFTEVPDAEVRPGKSIELAGLSYRRVESGSARYTTAGTTGLDSGGTVHYQDYTADDDTRLALEAYGDGGKWEVSRGEVLSRYEVRIFPASVD